MSKVRRQLGILQLKRGNGTSCYWQGTDVWGKVGIQRPFFFWQKSTRETQETRHDCHPMKEKPLNIQRDWHANIFFFFWFYTPKTSDCWRCQYLWARGETWHVQLPQHSSPYRRKQSWAKSGWRVCSLTGEEGKKSHRANSSDPSAKSHKLLAVHTVRAPMYTQANTGTHIQIQDVGSQFSKHSSYPLLL